MLSRKTRVIRRKLDCLNPNPQRWNTHTRCYSVYEQRYQGQPVRVSRAATSAWQGDG